MRLSVGRVIHSGKLMMKQEKMVDFKVPKFQKFQSSKFQSPNESPINSGKLIEGRKHTS